MNHCYDLRGESENQKYLPGTSYFWKITNVSGKTYLINCQLKDPGASGDLFVP